MANMKMIRRMAKGRLLGPTAGNTAVAGETGSSTEKLHSQQRVERAESAFGKMGSEWGGLTMILVVLKVVSSRVQRLLLHPLAHNERMDRFLRVRGAELSKVNH